MLNMPETLDERQRAIIDAVMAGKGGIAITGAPGTGKTVTALASVAACWQREPGSAVLLTSSRRSAAALKPALAARLPEAYSGTPIRTAASLAFDLVRQGAMLRGDDVPRLLTGAEQDRLLADIIAERSRLGDPIWPSHIDAETRALAGFRDEVRDCLAMATALRLTPEQLESIESERWGSVWRPLANLFQEYLDVKHAVYGSALDVNELMLQASWELEHAAGKPLVEASLACLIVDDAQESTLGLPGLLAPIVRAGVRLVTFGDADATVGRFQGAQPVFATQLHEAVGAPAAQHFTLHTEYRCAGAIARLANDLVDTIGVSGGVAHRHPVPCADRCADVTVESVAPSELGRSLAGTLRTLHYLDGVPWSELAIVVRSQGLVHELDVELGALGLPTRSVGAIVPRHESASSILLDAVAWACGVLHTDEVVEPLATSYLGGLTSIDLKRLMRWMRLNELGDISGSDTGRSDTGRSDTSRSDTNRSGSGIRTGRALLEDWLDTGSSTLASERRVVRRFQQFVDVMRHARQLANDGATAEELLWTLWSSAHVADVWQREALGQGTDAALANRNLDAILALFQSAQRYVEQTPDRPAGEWVRRMREQPLPEDVIGASDATQRITISTPSSVVGTSFDCVILTGLTNGAWPNLRIRDSLLGASALAAAIEPGIVSGSSRRDVLHDELRLLYYSVTRARRRIMVFDVEGTDDVPSPFSDIIRAFCTEPAADETASIQLTGLLPSSLAAFTGIQRRRLLSSIGTHNELGIEQSAALLRQLAESSVRGADPSQWHGVLPVSSSAPRAENISISPSSLERFETCQLAWVADRLGGDRSMAATNVGTIVHQALEAFTTAGTPLEDTVEQAWQQLVFEAPFAADQEWQQAQLMLQHLREYLHTHESDSVVAEIKFEFEVNRVPIHGIIDRIEQSPDGVVTIVDLKTGKHPPSKADAETNGQLGCYQLALLRPDALKTDDETQHALLEDMQFATAPKGNPTLLYVRTRNQHAVQREQHVFDADGVAEMETRIAAAAEHMGDSIVDASVTTHCTDERFGHRCLMLLTPAVSE